jgi:glycosyltransferase involved in cell wall biosynthesis
LTVALSGLGGDEAFGGYRNFRNFARLRRLGILASLVPGSSPASRRLATATTNRTRKAAAVARAGGDALETYRALRGMFGWEQLESLLAPAALEYVRGAGVEREPVQDDGDAVNLYSRLELENYLRNTLLRDTDSMSMAHALEVRVPLLDAHLLELLATIPGTVKVRPGQTKPLLVAAAPRLPEGIAARPKMGFVLPLDRWFRGPLSGMLEDVLAATDAPWRDLFMRGGGGGFDDLRNGFLRGERYVSHSRILCLVALARWCDANRVTLPAQERRPSPRPRESRMTPRTTRRPRVLIALPGAFSAIGGIEMYNRLVIRATLEWARERGAECEILVANDEDGAEDSRYLPGAGARIRGFSRQRMRFASALLARAATFSPDVLVLGHVNFARLGPALLAACPRARFWYLTHGIDVWRRLDAVSRAMLRRAERVFAVSGYTRDELARWNGLDRDAIELLPCALDPVWEEEFASGVRPDAAQDAATILTVARLHESERYKGIDSVLRALAQIAASHPSARYEIVGDGSDRGRLEALARELGVADRVRFLGRATPAALAEAYARCSFFAMPSSKEGFGIVFLEAALFGKPSIGGRHGGTPEVVIDGQTGLLVDREDVSALCDALRTLLDDPERRRALGDGARRRLADRYRYDSFRRAFVDHLDADCAPAAAPATIH